MKPGRASRTAVIVAMGRAAAHGIAPVERFADPTALVLLPDEARARVERYRSGAPPVDLGDRFAQGYLRSQSAAMVARTVAIDDVVNASHATQVVILGAGLDGRAWRMDALRDATVFEVDHPDSQRFKRSRIATLTRHAREVRFVPVDFTRDSLDTALESAGHDPTRATLWIQEGVVMYLTVEQVDATLSLVARRSTPDSELVINYHSPAVFLRLVGFVFARMGEPFRSAFTPVQMRALLARRGFRVTRDQTLAEIGAALSPAIGAQTRRASHQHVAVATRTA